jgi:enoyl-CoA hydratase/carnithine racemase
LTRPEPTLWTIPVLGRFLIAPDAGELLSPVGEFPGPGALVLDLEGASAGDAAPWIPALLDQLPTLPCVTIALGGSPHEVAQAAVAKSCDVFLESAEELPSLLAGFATTPIAALAFVQLLRSTVDASIYGGLVSESFVYSTLQSGQEFRSWLETRQSLKKEKRIRDEGVSACRMDRDRDRLEIWLSRPEKHNAFSRGMRDSLTEALQLGLSDPSIEEIVLSGEGTSFCSGGDLDEFGDFPNPAEAHAIRTTRSPALLLSRLSDRVRCEVHGACVGAGAELPAFTGRVVATEEAFFQLPEVGLGLVPGAGGTVSLPRRIGSQRTAWLGLSGARIDARKALAWGLVDEVRLRQHVD